MGTFTPICTNVYAHQYEITKLLQGYKCTAKPSQNCVCGGGWTVCLKVRCDRSIQHFQLYTNISRSSGFPFSANVREAYTNNSFRMKVVKNDFLSLQEKCCYTFKIVHGLHWTKTIITRDLKKTSFLKHYTCFALKSFLLFKPALMDTSPIYIWHMHTPY